MAIGLAARPIDVARGQPRPCVRAEDLPYQLVEPAERIVHLGDRPGWAGRNVTLCAQDRPVGRIRFKVRESGVTLDCNGVVFDGAPQGDAAAVRWALDVDRGTPGIRDVTIRGCEFHNYQNGLLLTGPDIADHRPARALHEFRVEQVTVVGSRSSGIYVGAHARDFTIAGVEIRNARTTGLYLDAYSRRTRVTSSLFEHNGWSTCSHGREAIAIDGSSHNVIVNNTFIGNRYAAIALYKNCGEGGVPRTEGSHHNTIAFNVFREHDVAIRVAARQGLDPTANDCLSDDCTDEPAPGTRRYLDHARHNTVSNNYFVDNRTAIQVADADNAIRHNGFFTNRPGAQIVVRRAFLDSIGRPLSGLRIERNSRRHYRREGGRDGAR